jgi:Domain of unknown function (DUF4352)
MRLRVLSLLVAALSILTSSTPARAQATCTFTLGFRALRDQIPAVVGACLENEHFNVANGNAEQRTSGGLLVWRKADNWTAFTDGGTTWLNGPFGLQSRPNQGPFFAWELIAATVPAAAPVAVVPQSVPVRTTPPPPPTTPARADTYDGVTAKILEVQRGWKSTNQFIKADSGNEFLTISLQLNNGTSETRSFNGLRFKIVMSDNSRWSSVPDWRDPGFGYGDMLAFGSVRGWITFEIPRSGSVAYLLWEPRSGVLLPLGL